MRAPILMVKPTKTEQELRNMYTSKIRSKDKWQDQLISTGDFLLPYLNMEYLQGYDAAITDPVQLHDSPVTCNYKGKFCKKYYPSKTYAIRNVKWRPF